MFFIYSLYNIQIKLLYRNLVSALNLQIVILYFAGLKNGKTSIIKVLSTTFHRQEKKFLGFWVFFVVLRWVLQLTLKQIMVLVLENLVIYGTNILNRFDRGSLHNPLVH